MTDLSRSSHEQNLRQAFDGMARYHTSELTHKAQTIEMLKSIVLVVLAAYGGLLGAVVSGQHLGFSTAIVLSAAFFVLSAGLTATTVYPALQKFTADHKTYLRYRGEYVAARKILGINEDLLKACAYSSPWAVDEAEQKTTGVGATKWLLWMHGATVVTASFCGSALTIAAVLTRG